MDIPLQMKYQMQRMILNKLEQDEKTDFKYIFQAIVGVDDQKPVQCYVIATNYRLMFIQKKLLEYFEVEPPILFNEIPSEFYNQEIKIEKVKSQQFIKTQISDAKSKSPLLKIQFIKFWKHLKLAMKQEEYKKFQSFLAQPIQNAIPFNIQAKIDILQNNELISNIYKDTFITKKVKIIEEDVFWDRQDAYIDKEKNFVAQQQEAYTKNISQIIADYTLQCTLYALSPIDKQQQYQEQLTLENDCFRNLELQTDLYLRNRPPKKIKNKDLPKELIQDEIFFNIYEQQKINKELGKQFIQTFILKMIDKQFTKQKQCILDQSFYKQLEKNNDGLNVENIQDNVKINQKLSGKIKNKSYLTNQEWEKDKLQIVNQLDIFRSTQFEKLDINQVIKDDYKTSSLQKSKSRLEEREKEYFTETRKLYQTVKRLLQYLYYGLKLKKASEEMKEYIKLLQEEIKGIRINIQKVGKNINDRDKYKIMILEDLQKQIEKAMNEIIYY